MPTSFAHRVSVLRATVVALTLASTLAGTTTSAASATTHPTIGSTLGTVASVRSALHPRALLPPQNPVSNVAPTSSMYDSCVAASSSNVASCDRETVSAIDAARANEGVGPLTLPIGYDQMPPNEQILVVSNLERTDRGLAPVAGLSSSLDTLAQLGAQNHTDPAFPSPFDGTSGGANWASTSSVLFADFLFMYDDGPGPDGINLDCTSLNTSGCWGHRDNILGNFDQPILMGAATVSGSSLTEEFIGGDGTDRPDVTAWSSLASLFPVTVSTTSVSLNAGVGAPKSSTVTVFDSGVSMNVTASITPSGSEWSLGTYSCDLSPGASCPLTVYLAPVAGAVTSATLRVTGPNGSVDVALNATAVAPGVPGAPLGVVARLNASHVHVSWNAPSSDGGDAVVDYRVFSTPAGLHCVTSSTQCVMTYAGAHRSYVFNVVAQNAVGLGPHSTPSNQVTFR